MTIQTVPEAKKAEIRFNTIDAIAEITDLPQWENDHLVSF